MSLKTVKTVVLAVVLGLLVLSRPASMGFASGQQPDQAAWQVAAVQYHGNQKSHVFHRPGCQHYNCKNCTVVFSSREEAVNAGYRACKVCRP